MSFCLLMIVWVDKAPGLQERVSDPVPSGFLVGTTVKEGEDGE